MTVAIFGAASGSGQAGPFSVDKYTGNGTSQTIPTRVAPDLTWIKSRSGAYSHTLVDKVRGATKTLATNSSGAESTIAQSLTAFTAGGFTVGSDQRVNENASTYVAYSWKETAGFFDIVTFTGTEPTPQNVSHSLGVAPSFMILKPLGAASWPVYHASRGNTKTSFLNATSADSSGLFWNNTTPTSSVFSVGNASSNQVGTVVAYLFAEVAGQSKFGTYTGSAGAQSVTLGFQPSLVLIKNAGSTGDWVLVDNQRGSTKQLFADLSDAESSVSTVTLTSYGFDLSGSDANTNANTNTYIYAAWR